LCIPLVPQRDHRAGQPLHGAANELGHLHVIEVAVDQGLVGQLQPVPRTEGWFEVIPGKVLSDEGEPTCFAFVSGLDAKPKRRLFEALRSRGLQMNQRVEFLTNGGDTVRELPLFLCPESEHWLDWLG
jgi:hypothetical protein